jgi:hypothetical protein
MMSFGNVIKWVGLVVLVLVLAVGLARLFSGEDDHHPGAPPPAQGRAEAMSQRILPWFILCAAGAGLAGAALLSGRSPATRGDLGRSLRLFGAVGVASTVLAGSVVLALGVTLASGVCCGPAELSNETALVLLCLLGLAGFLTLVAVYAHGTKKVLEAHYDLRRAATLMEDTLERLAERMPRVWAE